ncbi:zinc-dependent alcohol dehydrogenase family protein [Planctomicrobium sp. SH661]|uniref:zinc-dependent alcohol dehydrogenase family protein n=1 Tax=Planctomicrobium sp. SH661 TaxID=3448124 RepID=UPI003F5BB428
MKAMVLRRLVSLDEDPAPLEMTDLPQPIPATREILIRVSVCGVCHTELDEIEGRTPPPQLPMVLGHQVVGRVAQLGPDANRFRLGDRVGVGWIHSSTGAPDENLSPAFRATGRDAPGGYAEFMTVPEAYACPIPEIYSDEEVAPLLCAGAVGYRALKLTQLTDGQSLGLTGFGGSAHLVIQLVRYLYPQTRIFVFARDPQSRKFATELGASWAGDTSERAPEGLDAIIDTTPAWGPVIEALSNLKPGGRLVINAIRKEDRDKHLLMNLSYHEHLWLEREIKTVANVTYADLSEFLKIAAGIPIRPEVQVYPLSQANQALDDLKHRPVQGAKVLRVASE